MKKIYEIKNMLTIMLISFSFITVQSQVRLKKVDPSNGAVTLHNYGGSTVNVGSYWICNFPDYDELSSLSVTQGSLNLAAGAEVTVTSTIGLQVGDSELGLYNSSSFGSSTAMQDYVQWGSAGHQREVVAVNKGIWSAGTFVSATPPLEYTGNGSQNGSQFWGSALGIDEFNSVGNFRLIQNPVENNLFLEFAGVVDQGEIIVHNILGVFMTSKTIESESSTNINTSNFSKGIYFVTVNSNDATQTKRFIKK